MAHPINEKARSLADRALIVQELRSFFTGRGYLEVETPIRIPAPAPEANIEAPASEGWFLQTSPELCMKRLLADGFPKIFQICKCFRAGERGRRHLAEFSMLEWYCAGVDYRALMDECEELVGSLASRLGLGNVLSVGGNKINLLPPWPRITVEEAFDRFAGIAVQQALDEDRFDEAVAFEIEPRLPELGKPVFLIDYPAQLAALSRRKPENPNLAERFELYIGAVEIANAFSELTDHEEQEQRFREEMEIRRKSGRTVYPWPAPFMEDLKKMPEAAGIALGMDRLVMVLTGCDAIDEVVAFTPESL